MQPVRPETSLGVVCLDGRQLHHAVIKGREVRVGIDDVGWDSVEATTLELSKYGQEGAVGDGGGWPTEVASP